MFAKALFSVLDSGKRCININETWLPHTNFLRRKWRVKGDNNSVPLKDMSQRVNMIAAIDTEGNAYVSLTQVNTDANVMILFL